MKVTVTLTGMKTKFMLNKEELNAIFILLDFRKNKLFSEQNCGIRQSEVTLHSLSVCRLPVYWPGLQHNCANARESPLPPCIQNHKPSPPLDSVSINNKQQQTDTARC